MDREAGAPFDSTNLVGADFGRDCSTLGKLYVDSFCGKASKKEAMGLVISLVGRMMAKSLRGFEQKSFFRAELERKLTFVEELLEVGSQEEVAGRVCDGSDSSGAGSVVDQSLFAKVVAILGFKREAWSAYSVEREMGARWIPVGLVRIRETSARMVKMCILGFLVVNHLELHLDLWSSIGGGDGYLGSTGGDDVKSW